MWGGYFAKGSESASPSGPAPAVVGESLEHKRIHFGAQARMVGKVLHGEHWVKLTNSSESTSPPGPMPVPQHLLKAGEFTSVCEHSSTHGRELASLYRLPPA